jgi:large subunit ribosomal protein L21
MTDLAIIKKGLHQYALRKGEYLDMPHIEGAIDTKVEFPEVLLTQIGEKTEIGQPLVKDAKVIGTIIKQFRGPKFEAAKFKAKSRYRKQWGYREELTRVRVDEIVVK